MARALPDVREGLKPVHRRILYSIHVDNYPPDRAYTERIYRRVGAYMTERGMDASIPKAGCARCQACSGLQGVQPLLQIGRGPTRMSHVG